ncbi:hypothetical protein B566_EDAN006834 [Ephemera danica]|nr:hypothetical protein B566_EDAN006834 [Ephemera danica]
MKDITHYFQSANPKPIKLVSEKEDSSISPKLSQKDASSKATVSKKSRKSQRTDSTASPKVTPKRKGRPKKVDPESANLILSDLCQVEYSDSDNNEPRIAEGKKEETEILQILPTESDVTSKEVESEKKLVSSDNEPDCINHTVVTNTELVILSESSNVLPSLETAGPPETAVSPEKTSAVVSEGSDPRSVDLQENKEKNDSSTLLVAEKQNCEQQTEPINGTSCTEELTLCAENSTNESPCSMSISDVYSDDETIIIRNKPSDRSKTSDQAPKCKSLSLKKRKSTRETSKSSVTEQTSALTLAVDDKKETENLKNNVQLDETVAMDVSLENETKLPSESVKKTESPNAFKVMMSVRKESKVEVKKSSELSPQEPVQSKRRKQDLDSQEVKVPSVSKGKRKRIIESDEDEEIEEDPKQSTKQLKDAQKNTKSPGIFTYFSPVSKDDALKKSTEMNSQKVVSAEIHPSPKVQKGSKRPLGPVRRAHRLSNDEGDDITVVMVEEFKTIDKTPKSPEKAKFKTPDKSGKSPEKGKRKTSTQSKLKTPEKTRRKHSDDSDSITSISPDFKQQKKLPLAPIFLLKQRKQEVVIPPAVTKLKSRQIFPSVVMAPVRSAPTEHTIGFAEYDPSTPMAVLFPSVSHVTQHEEGQCPKEDCDTELSEATPNNEVTSVCTPNFPSGEFVDITSPVVSSAAYRDDLPSMDCQESSETWCEQYRPMSSEEVAGNDESVGKLHDWLDGWKQRRRNSEDQMECDSDESSDYSSSDDFICYSDEESDEGKPVKSKTKRKKHCNTALLVGPCGSGKTAAVYAAAEELGFKVLEMNASSRRSGKRILSELQEATQSHQVRNTVEQATLNSFFSDAKKPKKSEDVKESQPNSTSSNPGLSLILVEDVDVIFEEQDEGFLAALNVLAASSKRPLVLVSNDPQCPVIQKMCGKFGAKVGDKQLATLTHECDGDLRRAVTLAQMWTGSGGFPHISANNLSFPLDLSQLWYNMCTISLPFIVSQDEVMENNVNEADTTWNSGIAEEDVPKSPVCTTKAVKRRRIESDSSADCGITQSSTWPTDLHKTQRLTDILSILDVLQGSDHREMVSYERPGLSDQESYEQSANKLGQEMQHWLASRALTLCNASLAHPDLEEIQRWKEAHIAVDRDMMAQMPMSVQLDQSVAAQDLLPFFRDFGRTEQISARSSRRSKLNALTTMGFTLTSASMENLQFIFTPSLESMEMETV